MFDVPEAKRIRRTELFKADDEESHDSNADEEGSRVDGDVEAYSKLFHFQYDFSEPEATSQSYATTVISGTEEAAPTAIERTPAQTFEFRLFTSKSDSPGTVPESGPLHPPATITICSPTPSDTAAQSKGRFVKPYRPRKYYFTDPQTPQDSANYALSAVSSQEVLKRATLSWPGTALPWRIIHVKSSITTHIKHSPAPASAVVRTDEFKNGERKKKSRLSKKRRIILRSQQAAVDAKAESERINRARRNREKKVKRREKDKLKKAQKVVEGEEDVKVNTQAEVTDI